MDAGVKEPPIPETDQHILAEKKIFQQLQHHFAAQYEAVFPNRLAPKTIVVIPSLTLDQEILCKIDGIVLYEERLLCLLLLLRMPRTHIVYVTSTPIDPVIIDYYLHLLPGITGHHAIQRLHLLSCYDASPISLTEKILARPRLMRRIKNAIPADNIAHLSCFNVTEHERKLAVTLGLPIYGCDPDLFFWGTKSGSREIFRECGLDMPPGFENLENENDIIVSLARLKKENPALKRAVIKMNDGFSGEGNAVFSYEDFDAAVTENELRQALPQRLKIVAKDLSYKTFIKKFEQMGGIVEAFIEGKEIASPSVQCRINPLGKVDIISTHDQIIGGESDQVFLGATFPAHTAYSRTVGHMGRKVAAALRKRGVLGRFGLDFLSVRENDTWIHYAIEINLRKGGTTHPYIMLQFLTEGDYDAESGKYFTAGGDERFYMATDNFQEDCFKGLTPHDLMDIAMLHGLHFNSTKEEGVMFHLIGALSQYGKLGLVCIGDSPERARFFYDETLKVLRGECGWQNR
ncbi:MAG: ATP-grasp domain-containing protein [Terrimonas sp.]|nr:ATP-grasp domain-containing protein [Terrimonas sp.]